MGKVLDFGYRSPNSALFKDRAHMAPAAVKTSSPEPTTKLEPSAVPIERVTKVERVATPDLRDSRLTHAKKDATAAVRRARWRKKNPEQHADQQRAARARRKAGKATA